MTIIFFCLTENNKQVSSDEGSLNKNDLSKDFNLDKLWDFEHRDMEHETEKLRREVCTKLFFLYMFYIYVKYFI